MHLARGTMKRSVAFLVAVALSAWTLGASAQGASPPDAPGLELHWPDGREQLIADTTLAHLPVLPAAELESTLERLRAFERELSDLRHSMHEVIDVVEREIAARQVAGTTG